MTFIALDYRDVAFAALLIGINAALSVGFRLGLERRLLIAAARERNAIEARLSLGDDFAAASETITREAIRAGLIPVINSMSAAGLVFLPGMMTGQILAGIEPVEAVKYQLLVMFLIAGGTGLGVLAAVISGRRLLTDRRDRLRLERLLTSP